LHPALSDQGASQLLDRLDELAAALGSHYALQLRRYYSDLFEEFADNLPEF
jgi:hypothetical protein